jgi:hypothetical protein
VAHTHGLLRLWGEAEWGRRAANEPAVPAAHRPAFWRRWRFPIPRFAFLVGSAVAVAAALLWAGNYFGTRRVGEPAAASASFTLPASEGPARATGVAVLKGAADVVWENGAAEYQPGETLLPGWLRLRAGAVQLEFARGTRVLLEGPAELHLISATVVQLKLGRLRAQVSEAASGFRVQTAGFQLVDCGADFGCWVPASGEAQVFAFAGEVALTPATASWPAHAVVAPGAVAIGPAGPRSIPAQAGLFLSDRELAAREQADADARLEHWRAHTRSLSEHASLVLHYTFESVEPWERTLRNQARQAPSGTDATLVGCNWTRGRWPGKGAVEFSRNDDRIRVQVPGDYPALTFLAWLRVDSLPNNYSALVMTESLAVGEIHWALTQHGGLLLSARLLPPTSPADWSGHTTPQVLTPDRLGSWMLVASTYDTVAGTVAHFVNGERVALARLPVPPALKLGNLEIGNWGIRADAPRWARLKQAGSVITERSFKGRLDEFALFSAPLSPAEIRALYDAGKPVASPQPVLGLTAPAFPVPNQPKPPRS